MKLTSLALFAITAFAQGPATTIFVSSPQPRIVSGDSVKLLAVARDNSGVARSGDTFTWTSTNANVASVAADGTLAARALGYAEIRAAIGNLRGSVWVQVVPSRIVVTPGTAQLTAGDRLQFKAAVLNRSGAEIPGAAVTWDIVNAMLRTTVVASVDRQGMVATSGAGRLYVRARFNYSGQFAMPFTPFVEGTATLDVELRKSHQTTARVATGPSPERSVLRGRRSLLSSTTDGRLVFLGSLDGTATGIMTLDNGRLQTLAASGEPGPVPSGLIYEFQNFAANGKGEVLTRTLVAGAAHGILLTGPEGSRWLGSEGMYLGGIESVSSFFVTRNSLNDDGDALVRATYRLSGETVTNTGLFRFHRDGSADLVASTADGLPGFTGPYTFDGDFGIAADGTAFFRVSGGGRSAVYKQYGFDAPVRVIRTGDGVINGFVGATHPTFFVSARGDLVFAGTLSNNSGGVVHVPPQGEIRTYPYRAMHGVFDVRDGNVLWYGDTGRGIGLQMWKPDGGVDALIAHGAVVVGDAVTQIDAGTLLSDGQAVAIVRTPSRPFLVVRATGTPEVLTGDGADADRASVSMTSLVQGANTGAPMMYGGGDPSNLLTLDNGRVQSLIKYGDRFDGNVVVLGLFGSNIRRSSDGTVYVFLSPFGLNVPNYGVYRWRDGNLEQVLKFNFNWPDGTPQFTGSILFATDDGSLLLQGGTGRGHSRLYTLRNGQTKTMATTTGNNDYLTRIEGGGVVAGWNEAVMTPSGTVLAHLRFDGAPNGAFLWENDRWTETAVVNSTQLLGLTITNINAVRAAGERLFGSFNLTGGGSALAEWKGGKWEVLVSHRDDSPTGQPMSGIGNFDVNSRGEIAFFANSFSWPVLLHRAADGRVSIAAYTFDFDDPRHSLVRFIDLDLRDDGTIWFLALDVSDRYVLFESRPR